MTFNRETVHSVCEQGVTESCSCSSRDSSGECTSRNENLRDGHRQHDQAHSLMNEAGVLARGGNEKVLLVRCGFGRHGKFSLE